MKRRDFLRVAMLGCVGALAEPVRAHSVSASKRVIVVGAGLAGLVCAWMIAQEGHDVVVVEAQARPGGRVCTIRSAFDDGLHAEAGALFVPSNHQLTLDMVRRFGLSLRPAAPPFEARLFYVRGRRVVANWGTEIDWPFELTPEEQRLGLQGLWRRYVTELDSALTDEALDRMSVADLLRQRGASDEAIALLRIGFLDMMGDGIESYSALQLRQRLTITPVSAQRYVIQGGTQSLPQAIAKALGARIRYVAPVAALGYDEQSAWVIAQGERLQADRVVCTVPAPVLRRLVISPSLSKDRESALAQLHYTSVARIFLQFRSRPWTAENPYLYTVTDLPVKLLYDQTAAQPGGRGILEAQLLGREARSISALDERDRIRSALSDVERVFPGASAQFERGVSKNWDEDPWARGAFPYFQPGQMSALRPHLPMPHGRIHFAGDYTSTSPGWMQGAIESGMRAAREVSEAA